MSHTPGLTKRNRVVAVDSGPQPLASGKIHSMRVSRTPSAASAAPVSLRTVAAAPGGPDRWPPDSFMATLPDAERPALLRSGSIVPLYGDEVVRVQGGVGAVLYVLRW